MGKDILLTEALDRLILSGYWSRELTLVNEQLGRIRTTKWIQEAVILCGNS